MYNVLFLLILFFISLIFNLFILDKISTSNIKYTSLLLLAFGSIIKQFLEDDNLVIFISIFFIFSGIIHAITFFKRIYKDKQ